MTARLGLFNYQNCTMLTAVTTIISQLLLKSTTHSSQPAKDHYAQGLHNWTKSITHRVWTDMEARQTCTYRSHEECSKIKQRNRHKASLVAQVACLAPILKFLGSILAEDS